MEPKSAVATREATVSPRETAPMDAAFAQYQHVLHRYLVRRLKSPHEAQDLMHDVYMRFLQISRQETIRHPQALLFRLASNFVYELKVRGRQSRLVYDTDLALEAAEGAADLSVDETS